jgi:sugar phosphate isomerase/epimerase
MGEMVEFAKDCGPNFGVVLDVWHWYHSGSTLDDIRKAGKSRIVLVHLSDAAKMAPEEVRDNQRLLAGEGVIDLVGIFKTLKLMDWEGSVSPEPLGRIPKDMSAEEGARLGLESAQAIMRKAGIPV